MLKYIPNLRNVTLAVAGLFGGPVVAAIAATMCGAYRLWLGGAGALVGVGVIVESTAFGVLFHFLWKGTEPRKISDVSLYFFGLFVHVVMLALVSGLPGGAGYDVLRRIGFPIIAIYPVATMLVCRLFVDYERQRQDSKALEESEERYRRIVETANEGIWSMDEHFRTNFVNEHMAKMLGYDQSEVIGRSVEWLMLEDVLVDHRKKMEDHQKGLGGSYERRFRHKDGSSVWTLVSAKAQVDDDGRFKGFLAMLTDITERKKLGEALRESEETYRMLFHEMLSGFARNEIICDPEGRPIDSRYLAVNPAFERLTGLKAEAVQGKRMLEVFPSLEPNWIETFGRVAQTGEPAHFESFVSALGVWFEVMAFCPAPNQYACTFSDITERKRAEDELRDSNEMLAAILDAVPQSIFWKDLDGVYLGCNENFAKTAGVESVNQIIGKTDYDLPWPPAHADGYCDDDREVLLGNQPKEHIVEKVHRADGTKIWVDTTKVPLRDDAGKPYGLLGVFEDITERKHAEDALREQDQMLREMSRIGKIGGWTFDPVTLESTWTEEVASIFERGPEDRHEVLHPDVKFGFSLFEGESLRLIESAVTQAIEHGKPYDLELEVFTPKGNHKWVRTIAQPVKREGQIVLVKGCLQDITELKKAEDALQNTSRRLRTAVEAANIGLWDWDLKTNEVFYSPEWKRQIGYEEHEISNAFSEWESRIHPDDLEQAVKRVRTYLEDPWRDYENEFRLRHKDGSYRWIRVQGSLLHDEQGNPVRMLGCHLDVTEQKRSQDAQLRLAAAIEQSAESVVIMDAHGSIEYANPAFERITGYSKDEVIGKHLQFLRSDAHDESFYLNLENSIRNGDTWKGRFIGRKKDGEHFFEDTTISPVRNSAGTVTNFVQLGHDVSERLELERQLFQAQKMESIGTLAGGIAHDFNNLLTVIQGYSELILMGTEKEAPHYSDLKAINFAATRGANLVKRILTFSRKIETEPRPIDLNEEIRNAKKLLDRTLPKMIETQLALAKNLERVNADPGQMEQILLNLAVNARDSMPDGGKFIIETRNVILDRDYCATHVEASPGEYVMMKVSDTGHGMEREVVHRIFEPFFSTKKPGEGTGLGLAMVFGIVKGHGGHITCYSQPGVGTAFHIYLPVIHHQDRDEEIVTRQEPAGGTETLLLVDDEEFIRDLGTRILTAAGYSVLFAENGEDALEIYEEKRSAVALVILDLIMPKMGGMDCLTRLLALNPEVKVVIASGLLPMAETKEAIRTKAKGFVGKPFERTKLLKAVRSVLDEE